MVYQGEGADGLPGEGAGGLPGGGGWWSARGRGLVVCQGEGAGGLSGGGVFRDWSRRLLGRRLDLAPYFQPGFGFPRGLRQRMTGDHYAQQHRQALSEHADQALLRPGPPPPRLAGGSWSTRGTATPCLGPPTRILRRPAGGGRWYRPDRRLGDRRVGELLLVGLPAHCQHVPRRHRQHQPQPLHTIRIRHPRRLPLPAAALEQLESPTIHDLIPYHSPSAWSGSRSVTRNHGFS